MIVTPTGIIKSLITDFLGETPNFSSADFIESGITTAELAIENPNSWSSFITFKNLKGFFLVTAKTKYLV